jgi:hypothetical protein
VPDELKLGDCRFELLTDGEQFLGLGAIYIGSMRVRSGRLPLRPYTQTFTGLELAALRLVSVDSSRDCLRLKSVFARAIFRRWRTRKKEGKKL